MKPEEPEIDERVPDPESLYQETRDVAYQIYAARQERGIPGDEVTDWLDAEVQVRARHGL